MLWDTTGKCSHFGRIKLKTLPHSACLLDIGTGNGALAVLCFQYGQSLGGNWQILGIDAADINPRENIYSNESINLALQKIVFQGNTFIENSNLEADSYDFISSQYAIEYADLSKSINEVFRVLKPNGKFCALMHSCQSEIVKDSKVGLAFLDELINETNFLKDVSVVLSYSVSFLKAGRVLADDPEFKRLNQSLIKRVSFLKSRAQDAGCEVWFNSILSRIGPLLYNLRLQNVEIFADYCEQLSLYRMRIQDQLNAIVDKHRKEIISSTLDRLGVKYCFSELIIEHRNVGLILEFNKS